MMDITTILLIIAIVLLLFTLRKVVKRLDQQEQSIAKLYGTLTQCFDLMSALSNSNKKIAACLKETMVEVEGHSEMIEKCFKEKSAYYEDQEEVET